MSLLMPFDAPYTARGFTLSFPEPLDQQDWGNFEWSLATNVQLWWDQANERQLRAFAMQRRMHRTRGVERVRVVLRLPNEHLRLPTHVLQSQLSDRIHWSDGAVVAVVAGNEQEPKGSGLRWGRAWGNNPAPGDVASRVDVVRARMEHVLQSLAGYGVALVAGGYGQHGFREDDAPDPGLHTWREELLPVVNRMHGHDAHYYEDDWWVRDPEPPDLNNGSNRAAWLEYSRRLVHARVATKTNVDRFMHWVRFMSGFHHTLVYIGECNVNRSSMSQVERMEACVGKSKLLAHHRNPEGVRLGERVAMFSPFTSNGLGNHYEPRYIMRDPRCYDVVRAHMVEEGYIP
jgi:hypothetical protein